MIADLGRRVSLSLLLAGALPAQLLFSPLCWENVPPGLFHTRAILLCDVEGDGDLDLWLHRDAGGDRTDLLLNDGRGRFAIAPPGALPAGDFCNGFAAGDLDGDRDLDVVQGRHIFFNDGKGFFTNATETLIRFEEQRSFLVAMLDVDGDGDLDLVAGGPRDFQSRIFFNLTRQVHDPARALSGREFRLDLHARNPAGDRFQLVLPFFSPTAGSTILPPFGLFGLGSVGLVSPGPLFIHPGGKPAALHFTIAGTPALVGQACWCQGLHVTDLLHPPVDWRFTNVIRVGIHR